MFAPFASFSSHAGENEHPVGHGAIVVRAGFVADLDGGWLLTGGILLVYLKGGKIARVDVVGHEDDLIAVFAREALPFVGSDGLPVTQSPLGNPFLFHGMFWDAEIGSYHNAGGQNFGNGDDFDPRPAE